MKWDDPFQRAGYTGTWRERVPGSTRRRGRGGHARSTWGTPHRLEQLHQVTRPDWGDETRSHQARLGTLDGTGDSGTVPGAADDGDAAGSQTMRCT